MTVLPLSCDPMLEHDTHKEDGNNPDQNSQQSAIGRTLLSWRSSFL
ncbi:hypothetical protein KQH49_12945 [Mycetohabitans sp. B5]|nr:MULTISPECIES: hypothetical protein [Mycetohabitans]MCG1055783.1 hypothetical protein [Mycetohabitans sp. B5]